MKFVVLENIDEASVTDIQRAHMQNLLNISDQWFVWSHSRLPVQI